MPDAPVVVGHESVVVTSLAVADRIEIEAVIVRGELAVGSDADVEVVYVAG